MSVSSRYFKSKRRTTNDGPLDLESKVKESGGDASYGLEISSTAGDTFGGDGSRTGASEAYDASIYGGRRIVDSRSVASTSQQRFFRQSTNNSSNLSRRMKRPSTSQSRAGNSTIRANSSYRQPSSKNRLSRSVRTSRAVTHRDNAAVHIVCAVVENLARETCVASLDAGSPISLQVTKQGNGQTYAETLSYLQLLQPHEVLLNEGRRNSHLAKKVLELFGNSSNNHNTEQDNDTEARSSGPCKTATVVKFISRACFDQTKGATLLRRVARQDTYDATLVEEFILLSSAHAVLQYTQSALGATFSRNCLNININSGGKNRMAIDRATIMQLELLSNAKTGKTRNTLIATIDCTKTTLGSRLLRTNLIAPPCRIDTINARLDLVDTFYDDEEFFYVVQEKLESLPAIDKMLTNIAIVPRKNTSGKSSSTASSVKFASKGISALICIKSTLSSIPSLARLLKDYVKCLEKEQNDGETTTNNDDDDEFSIALTNKSGLLTGLGTGPYWKGKLHNNHLLKAIIYALSRPELSEIKEKVDEVFTASTNLATNANARCHQECFALKGGEEDLMDVTRKSYLGNVDDIYKKADAYAELHNIRVSVRYTTRRGYFLSIPEVSAAALPNVFIQPVLSGKFIHCTTEEVHSLNTRAQDNVQDLLTMTHERLHEVLDFARSKYDALASLADAVALLDLCHSFADHVTLASSDWCRPVMKVVDDEGDSDSTTLMIKNGRYAINVEDSFLASAEGPSEVVPNDTWAEGDKSFTVITGINGSGKSTYLKQIGIIVLLAHCGSYIPAERASIPLRTRLCARMGTSDDQENNISSFMLEMNETAFLCNNSSNGSLILIDELGRATGNQDGLAIAWAVAEYLMSKQAMTFFVTHYPQLCKLSDTYNSVQNQHLQAALPTDQEGEIRYTHKLGLGPCTQTSGYGIDMATSCGWPQDTITEARKLEANLQGWLDKHNVCVDQAKEKPCPNRAVATAKLKEMSKQLVTSVKEASSVSSLKTFLQNTMEASKDSYASEAWQNILEDATAMAAAQKDEYQEITSAAQIHKDNSSIRPTRERIRSLDDDDSRKITPVEHLHKRTSNNSIRSTQKRKQSFVDNRKEVSSVERAQQKRRSNSVRSSGTQKRKQSFDKKMSHGSADGSSKLARSMNSEPSRPTRSRSRYSKQWESSDGNSTLSSSDDSSSDEN